MRMILKHVLKPVCEYITSYQAQNVMFWVSENTENVLKITNFTEILLEAIHFLQQCLEIGCLEHYFIPSRNLMSEKLSDEDRSCLLDCFNEIQMDLTGVLRRCPLIHSMCTLSTDEVKKMLLFRKLSDEILTASLTIDPAEYETLDGSSHRAKSDDKLFECFKNEVVRQSNPFEYFDLISSQRDDDILGIFMQGILNGYDKEWID
jgi:hypothetical protein